MAVDIVDIQTPREPKEVSRPVSLWLPAEYKSADIDAKKGIVTAYLTVYKNFDGEDFVDPYQDVIHDGAFTKTINDLNQARKYKNNPYLCADLWQHDRKEIIGGIKSLVPDSKGVIYEAQLLMGVQRAREAFELAAAKMVGSSFGYDAIRFENKGDIRHLLEVRLHEVSQVTFPANDLAPILDTKENKKKNFYVPNLPKFPEIPKEQEYIEDVDEQLLAVKAICGSTGLAIGAYEEIWDVGEARVQIKKWGTDKNGRAIPEKYKQVHLQLDGKPDDIGSYSHPYCYIVNGNPQICVAGVAALLPLLTRKDAEPLWGKYKDLCSRINKRYPQEKSLVLPSANGLAFEWKQDFSEAWTQKLPSILMQEFFRAADTLTYVLMSNFNDDDVDDKTAMIDTCCTQFADCLKTWYPEYAAADEAQDKLGDKGEGGSLPYMGLYSADVSNINIKRAVENVKSGRTLSSATRKKLQAAIDSITNHIVELQSFIADEPTDGGDTEEPKSVMPPQYIFDITSGLNVLDTLAPASYRPQTPPAQKAHSPVSSFPQLPEYDQEVDITDLLASIQQSMGRG